MISRDAAAAIAKSYAHAEGWAVKAMRVTTVREIRDAGGREPNLYSAAAWRHCWIVYLLAPHPTGLHSSTVVMVDPESGNVVCAGDAGDEG